MAFSLGTLDATGGVGVIRTIATGAVRGRVTVASRDRDQPRLEIEGTPDGMLVLRADQTIELVNTAGEVRSRLETERGTHVDTILVRGRRALALVQDGKTALHGRWIELDPPGPHGALGARRPPRSASRWTMPCWLPAAACL